MMVVDYHFFLLLTQTTPEWGDHYEYHFFQSECPLYMWFSPSVCKKKNNLSYVLFYLVKAATIQWELRGFYNLTLYFWASNIPIYKTTVFFINIVIPSWFSYCAPRKLRILQRHHRVKYWRKRRGDQAGRGPALSPLHQLGMLCFFSFICEGGFALNHPHSLPWYRYNELTWK